MIRTGVDELFRDRLRHEIVQPDEGDNMTLGFYRELGNHDGPSLAESVDRCPSDLRSAVADYLDSAPALIVASTLVDDVIDPTRTRVTQAGVLTDGERYWPCSLGYYVRTHGVGVPDDLFGLVRAGSTPLALTQSELVSLLAELEVR